MLTVFLLLELVLAMLAAGRRKATGVVRYLSLDHQTGGLKGFGTILRIEMRHGYAIRLPLLGHLRQCEGYGGPKPTEFCHANESRRERFNGVITC